MQLQPSEGSSLAFERRSSPPRLAIGWARTAPELEAAQRLRYRVFAGEMGARLDAARQIDRDAFDTYCEHLVVRDVERGEIVGTYRILGPLAARAAGGYYAEQEFDMARLAHLRPCMVEVGRSCVHPEYRTGTTILLLWAGLLAYMKRNGHTHLFGCASIGMRDGGHDAALLWHRIAARHLGPAEYRVFPRCRLPLEQLKARQIAICPPRLPPLIKGYLNAGARVCGEPAWDPDFNTADLPVLLSIQDMSPRHQKHFGLDVIR